ncbi:MAG: hypothetical protein NWE88_03085 [Candidatus Bathyarchaeota archaeon]|nr:hypothetical protein [Candidatus Bathyarchaeota archaeon]
MKIILLGYAEALIENLGEGGIRGRLVVNEGWLGPLGQAEDLPGL